ncbi:T1SS secreted agglutinin RTX [Caballeronia glathei]|uniref:RapA2 cadherin-like domain-containing protein n=1 Tax=Caballeronia glathei TaxID=60547 RepID=A0A069PDS5_9BURK|nr:VCBS domain-containing protein [Caballeronia glathei]KDR38730.1 hypothetical protein BG61_37680 [Caballeronia glathei]CDY78958.1 T1SS secreted agglutinin RTX [Caballeronia glathei]
MSNATADNVTGNNTFVIRVQLVASDVIANQAGVTLANPGQLVFSDPDGDTPNSAAAVDRTVAASAAPTVVIREPTLQVSQSTATNPGLGVDQGDTVEYDITISNGTAATDFNAFDISFLDTLPAELSNLALLGVTYQGGATNNGGPDFELVAGQLRTASGANIDVAKGGSITIRVSGTVVPAAASETSFSNTATAQWTSLDGTIGGTANPAGERTGVDGTLNDYRASSTLTVPVAQALIISRVGGLVDTPAPSPTDATDERVTVGEVIRYRVVALFAEGATNDFSLQVTLQNGLAFTNDGTVALVFISNNGVTTDIANLITGGVLNITGNQTSPEALPITPDLSGAAPTGLLNSADITVATDANGNQIVTFHLGNLVNGDNDPDFEGVSLEFNARVLNQASNAGGAVLTATAVDRSGTTNLSAARTVREDVVEPTFTGLAKQVVSFDPTSATAGLGTADVDIRFTQSGSSPAYNVVLTDSFPGASNYAFDHLVINGVSFSAAELAGIGVTVDVTNGLRVTFDKLDTGSQVSVFYSANAPDRVPISPANATLTWTSLPDSFTTWGGSSVGAAASDNGERTGSGTSPNTYVRQAAAGLGVISGTLWNDTASATTSTAPDGPGLAGQTVTLTWAGLDGNLGTATDNLVYTTTTDASGQYYFGVLPLGVYRIDAPGTAAFAQPVGALAVRIDSDAATALGTVGITLADGGTAAANAGYVEQNDAPVNQLPATPPAGLEDTLFSAAGLSISDVDAGSGTLQVTLGVLHGSLSLSALPAGVTESGSNTAALTLTGNLAGLNTALANLLYRGNLNFNGTDTLTITTNDRGNFGDHNGNGIPGELADALVTTNTVPVTVIAVNDAPVAVNDAASATEAGGNRNNQPGVDPTGNVLSNDTDVDIATNGDVLRAISVTNENGTTLLLPNLGSTVINGRFGALLFGANGGYQYTVDNSNPAIEALRLSGQTLTDTFTYVVFDTSNASSTGTLTVTIHGANDAPFGVNDVASATEAGGVLNGTPGNDATGNVLTNDTDVDSVANGETKRVTGVISQQESAVNSPLAPVSAQTTSGTGTSVAGAFGTLTIGADGTYRYVVDNNNAAVQQRVPGDAPLIETFTYQLTDAGGLSDLAELQIQVLGANDNPVASDDRASATAGSALLGVNPVNPSGNVITDASRPGTATQPGGNGVDMDVDHTGQPNTLLTINGIRAGLENAGGGLTGVTAGTTSANGTSVAGSFGTLHIGANGTYTYDVDSNNLAVLALAPGATLMETFTYQIVDSSGLTDRAQLVITVTGVNDPPVAQNDGAVAMEAGGINNGTPGIDPTGNVLANDADPDRDAIAVTGVRTGAEAGSGAAGTLDQVLQGQFGTLTLSANGSYSYVVNNANAAVQALRLPSDQLVDRFTYTIADTHGTTDQAELDVVIQGQNDAPVAQDDQAQAAEAGGTDNGTPGINPTANVLTNDTDVDASDTKSIDGVRRGREADRNALTDVTGATSIAGVFGTLTIAPDGSYTYTVDNSLPAVQQLIPGERLTDVFTYRMHDASGATDTAQLSVQIEGAFDAPVARDNVAFAVANNGNRGSFNPTGNVLLNDSDVDADDRFRGSGIRSDSRDAPGTFLTVVVGSNNENGTFLRGEFGDLIIGADGTFLYRVDTTNPTLLALRPLQTVSDVFTYRITDQGNLSASANLTIIVFGRNDAPVGNDDAATAAEAGGINNTAPGLNPSGNVLANDTDLENDPLHIAAIRTGGSSAAGGTAGTVGSALQGAYGVLTLAADGSWRYTVDNDLPAVQALRTSGQTLQDVFTYAVGDVFDAQGVAELRITIEGQNDAPVANNDAATAIEAGGVNNGTPGKAAVGNVLENDTDVDSMANGETKQVVDVSNETGRSAGAGTGLAGRYGHLTVNADGTYDYVVDNDNAAVQALRTRNDTLTEAFVYRMRDAAGAEATASLTIQIRGADDAPVAHDESNIASDQSPAPQANGNVLPNDTDVDANDHLIVVGVRSGEEAGTGTPGMPGQALAGRYGTLVLNADGSYTYQIDLSNPQVLAAAGLGQVLHDPFTYTVRDDAGETDQAQLVIALDIATPYVPPPGGSYFGSGPSEQPVQPLNPALEPVVFVTPEVEQAELRAQVSSREADGSQIGWPLDPDRIEAPVGQGLGFVPGQFVGRSVQASQRWSAFDRAWIFGRHGRTSLSADGLLSDPSVFAPLPENLTGPLRPLPEEATAQSFVTQLREAAMRLPPIPRNPEDFIER